MIDYSLWEVIENGNAPPITKVVEGVETTIALATAKEKAQRRLELKARSTLLMGIPNEHQLKFNSIKDAKALLRRSKTTLHMAYSSTSSNSKVSTDSNCSSSCLENVKILKEQNEQLLKDLRTSKLNAITYKTEVAITELRRKLELAQKQKDEIQLTVEKLKNSSKSLSKLIDCQIVDKCKTGLGYNVVPPPYTGNFMPPKPDLSFSGLEEFVNEPIVKKPVVETSEAKTSEAKTSKAKPKVVRKNNGAPIIEDWVSNSEEEYVPQLRYRRKLLNLVLLK
ncbi:hypothetical protein Tco_0921086 [Tanacetum coccineum]